MPSFLTSLLSRFVLRLRYRAHGNIANLYCLRCCYCYCTNNTLILFGDCMSRTTPRGLDLPSIEPSGRRSGPSVQNEKKVSLPSTRSRIRSQSWSCTNTNFIYNS